MISEKLICKILILILVLITGLTFYKIYNHKRIIKKYTLESFQTVNNDAETLKNNYTELLKKLNDAKKAFSSEIQEIGKMEKKNVNVPSVNSPTVTSSNEQNLSNINELNQYHNDIDEKIKLIIKNKFDVDNTEFNIKNATNKILLEKIQKKMKTLENLKDNKNKSDIISIQNLTGEDIINCELIDEDNNIHILFIEDGENKGCLYFDKDKDSKENIEIRTCEKSDTHQHFKIIPISNNEDVNKHIALNELGTNFVKPDIFYEDKDIHIVHPRFSPKHLLNDEFSNISIEEANNKESMLFVKNSTLKNINNCYN